MKTWKKVTKQKCLSQFRTSQFLFFSFYKVDSSLDMLNYLYFLTTIIKLDFSCLNFSCIFAILFLLDILEYASPQDALSMVQEDYQELHIVS